MPVLKFYDLAKRKSFTTDSYKVVKKKGRRFAVATGPSGNKCWRVMGK